MLFLVQMTVAGEDGGCAGAPFSLWPESWLWSATLVTKGSGFRGSDLASGPEAWLPGAWLWALVLNPFPRLCNGLPSIFVC